MCQFLNKKLPALILCIALLLGLCGCQKQKTALTFPLDSEAVDYLETLYGKTLGEMAKEWDFSVESLVEKPVGSGAWWMDQTTAIEGEEFTQTLMIDLESGMFCGLEYRCYFDSAEEAGEMAETLYAQALEEYGEPAYEAESGSNLLANKGIFDQIKGGRSSGHEVWGRLGEISWFEMNVDILADSDFFCIRLTYRVVPEEWHRFVPGYQAPFALFPVEE